MYLNKPGLCWSMWHGLFLIRVQGGIRQKNGAAVFSKLDEYGKMN